MSGELHLEDSIRHLEVGEFTNDLGRQLLTRLYPLIREFLGTGNKLGLDRLALLFELFEKVFVAFNGCKFFTCPVTELIDLIDGRAVLGLKVEEQSEPLLSADLELGFVIHLIQNSTEIGCQGIEIEIERVRAVSKFSVFFVCRSRLLKCP